MKRWGRIYLDEDYLLKDLSVLRHAGFQNVMERQAYGAICPVLFLSMPENEMIMLYKTVYSMAAGQLMPLNCWKDWCSSFQTGTIKSSCWNKRLFSQGVGTILA